MNAFKKLTASLLVICFTSTALPMQASAAIVSTQEASSSSIPVGERDRVIGFLRGNDSGACLHGQGSTGKADNEQ